MEGRDFPAGLLGKYYAARHSFGHYISCGITACYHLPASCDTQAVRERFLELLKFSLSKTIERHPALCYSITDKSEETEAHFTRVNLVEWHLVTQIDAGVSVPGEEDTVLSNQLKIVHQLPFTNQHGAPAWRLVVFFHKRSTRVDLTFLSSHAIGDGISGTAFHKTLFENLDLASTQTNPTCNWPYVVPKSIPRPILIEDATPLPRSPCLQAQIQSHETLPPYSFAPPLLHPLTTDISILTVPSIALPQLLNHCRSQNPPQTVTSLLHSLIVIYLSRTLPPTITSTHTFKTCTPFSMRRFSHTPITEIVNHIAYINSVWDSSTISLAQSSTDDSPEEAEVIAIISAQYAAEIKGELAAVPVQGATALRAIAEVKDWETELKVAETRERGYTYEISNIGRVEILQAKGDEVKLGKLIFTQCGMPVGPPIGCSVVSVTDGPLCIGFCWQRGVIDAEIMDGLKAFLERRLVTIGASN